MIDDKIRSEVPVTGRYVHDVVILNHSLASAVGPWLGSKGKRQRAPTWRECFVVSPLCHLRFFPVTILTPVRGQRLKGASGPPN
jgi:hypothetical protein